MNKKVVFSGDCDSYQEALRELNNFFYNNKNKLKGVKYLSSWIDDYNNNIEGVYFAVTVWSEEEIKEFVNIPSNFKDYYYKHYLPLHSKFGTKLMHLIGVLLTFIYIGFFLVNGPLWPLIFAPLVVYPWAWTSHWLIEKNKPAAWKNPLWAKLADLRMCWDFVRGRL